VVSMSTRQKQPLPKAKALPEADFMSGGSGIGSRGEVGGVGEDRE